MGAALFRLVSVLVERLAGRIAPSSIGAETAPPYGLYPLAVGLADRLAGRWLPGAATPAVVVSMTAFVAAMVTLVRAAELDLDPDRAEAAVLLAAVLPFASVFGREADDALFLLWVVASFSSFRRENWILGGLFGALATATRPTGILLVPALAWIGFRSRTPRRWSMTIGVLLAATGFVACLSYLYYRGGPPGGWTAAIDPWGFRVSHAPWAPLARVFASPRPQGIDAIDGIVALIAVATIPIVWWRLNGGYALYMIAMLWLPLSGASAAPGRTCAVLFPIAVLAAGLPWRLGVGLITATSALLYAVTLV